MKHPTFNSRIQWFFSQKIKAEKDRDTKLKCEVTFITGIFLFSMCIWPRKLIFLFLKLIKIRLPFSTYNEWKCREREKGYKKGGKMKWKGGRRGRIKSDSERTGRWRSIEIRREKCEEETAENRRKKMRKNGGGGGRSRMRDWESRMDVKGKREEKEGRSTE